MLKRIDTRIYCHVSLISVVLQAEVLVTIDVVFVFQIVVYLCALFSSAEK